LPSIRPPRILTRSRVCGVGNPGDLLWVRAVAQNELSIQHINRCTSQPHLGVGIRLAEFGLRTGLSGLEPWKIQCNGAEACKRLV